MKKLTEKQAAKVHEIGRAYLPGVAFMDPKDLRVARKLYSDKVKACDRILAIIAPPKPKTEK
jgi:hypothetical protein